MIAGRFGIVFVCVTVIRSSIGGNIGGGVGNCFFDGARNLLQQAKIYTKL